MKAITWLLSGVAWLRMGLRRLRQDRLAALGFALLVLATALVFAAVPRLLTSASQEGLQAELMRAPAAQLDLRLSQLTRPENMGGSTIEGVRGEGEYLEEQLPPALQAAIAGSTWVVATPLWQPTSGTPIESVIALRIQQDVEAHLRLVAGQWPSGATTATPDTRPDARPGATVTTFQVAMAADAAAMLQVGVGTTLALSPEPTDPQAAGRQLATAITITGLYQPLDAADPYWVDDAVVEGYTTRVLDPEHPHVDTAVLLSPDAYGALLDATTAPGPFLETFMPLDYEWRYRVDPARVHAASLADLTGALRRAQTLFPSLPLQAGASSGAPATTLQTGLLGLLEAHQAAWAVVQAVLTVAIIGAAAVALACLGLVAVLASRRRGRTLRLARGRGASRGQVIGTAAVECLVLVGPAAVVGGWLARTLVPVSAPGHLTGLAAAAVAVLAGTAYALALVPDALGPIRGRSSGERPRGSPLRRLVMEGFVIAAAVAGAVVLQGRGVLATSAAVAAPGPDPLVAAVPALAGLAAGLVAIRVYPLLMRPFGRVAARRRDVVPALGFRRVTRGGSGAAILLILLVSSASATFASATLVHLADAAEAVAWQEVGAPFRLYAPTGVLSLAVPVAGLPGVTAAAQGFQQAVTTSTGSVRTLVALDAAAYESVVAGTAVDPRLPAALTGPTSAAVLPAVVSPSGASENHRLTVGDTFTVTVASRQVELRVQEIRPTFPSVPVGDAFIVISQPQLAALAPPQLPPPTFAFLRAPDAALAALEGVLAGERSTAQVEGQAHVAAAVRGTPAMAAATGGVSFAALLAFAYAALAVVAGLALAGAARAVEMAHLRVFGLTGRQAVALQALEFGPTIAGAFLGGAALGLGLFVLLQDGLGLTALVGSAVEVPIALAAPHLALLLAALAAIVALGIGAGVLAQRGAAPATAIREGLE